jgi:hypothetical protein
MENSPLELDLEESDRKSGDLLFFLLLLLLLLFPPLLLPPRPRTRTFLVVGKDKVEHGRGECVGLFNELGEVKTRGSAKRWSSGGSARRWLWRRSGVGREEIGEGRQDVGIEVGERHGDWEEMGWRLGFPPHACSFYTKW